jgi:1,4-alpha-glucan branching enzyme
MHIGSWRKKTKAESLGYRELAAPLIAYLKRWASRTWSSLPVAEHAFYPSWGYQITGFFAPTSRYGTPDDFQFLVNELHNAGIGALVDWVPAHFPRDDWALANFDGTASTNTKTPQGRASGLGHAHLQLRRHEVVNFLIANALFWCERFHIDGPARGRRGFDALPRLLPQARRVGFPTSTAGVRIWRRLISSGSSITSCIRSIPA